MDRTTPSSAADIEAQPRSKDFGLIAWLENTRIRLPLRGMECRFEVCGDIANVNIEQVFHQSNKKPLNCQYSFPLPGNAAVYRCEIRIGNRTILAKVEEATKARKIYERKVAEGRRASLVEVERDNLFTLSLGNLQPEDLVVVKLSYFQTVDRVGKQLSLMIPFCPGVRYIPGFPLMRKPAGQGTVLDTDQVPDASRLTPPRMSAEHEDAAYVNIEGTITGIEVELTSLVSPMHKIHAENGLNGVSVRIDMSSGIPDRDFVLRWGEKAVAQTAARAWVCEADKETYALVQIKAPEVVQQQDEFEQDHYFLVDRSGSMRGEKWHKTALALQAFVRQLGPKDRIWITLFNTRYDDFAEKPMLKAELLADKGFVRIEERGADGGTEMMPALGHALNVMEEHSLKHERAVNLILITDGQVGNEGSILKRMRVFPQVPLYAFGIDVAVNDAFLRNLARQQRGDVVFQTPAEDIARAVEALGAKLRKPVITQLQVDDGWELADAGVQSLFEGSVVDIALRQTKSGVPVQLTGRRPDGKSHTFTFQPLKTSNPAVKLLWTKNRITWFLDQGQDIEAIRLAIEYNVLCRGTSFIAWDDAEKVPVAHQEIYQPSLDVRHCCEQSACFDYDQSRFRREFHSTAMRVGKMAVAESIDHLASYRVSPSAPPPAPSPEKIDLGFLGKRWFKKSFLHELQDELAQWVGAAPERRQAVKRLLTQLLQHKDDREACCKILAEFVQQEVCPGDPEPMAQQFARELVQAGGDPKTCQKEIKSIFKKHPQSNSIRMWYFIASL